MSIAISNHITFRPSVCYQTTDEHIHYNLILIDPTNYDYNDFAKIAGKLGVRTAGDVILMIKQMISIGDSLSRIGVSTMQVERLPLYQICHKGEDSSPSIDWDAVISFNSSTYYQ